MAITPKKKQTRGRQKIEIKKINNKSALQVTFTKRRTGIFQKASELCILCGAEIAIITFSPGKKMFTFGNPSTDYIIDKFQNYVNPSECAFIKNFAFSNTCAKKKEYYDAVEKFELEKEFIKETNEVRARGDQQGFWWDTPAEGMELEELQVFKDSLQELRSNVCRRITDLNMFQGNARNMFQGATVPPAVHLTSSIRDDSPMLSQNNINGMMAQYY